MYDIPRSSPQYLSRLQEFLNCAVNDMIKSGSRTIRCPCRDCGNMRRLRTVEEVRGHLIRRGFKEMYTRWTWHGESLDKSVEAGSSRDVTETFTEDVTINVEMSRQDIV